MSEMHELTDTEVETVCGGVSNLGNLVNDITKAVDEAISAITGGSPGKPIIPGPLGPPTKIMPL
jgi:hypothetical protein